MTELKIKTFGSLHNYACHLKEFLQKINAVPPSTLIKINSVNSYLSLGDILIVNYKYVRFIMDSCYLPILEKHKFIIQHATKYSNPYISDDSSFISLAEIVSGIPTNEILYKNGNPLDCRLANLERIKFIF